MPVCIKKAQTPHLDLRFLPPVNRQPFIQLSCNDTSDFPNQRIFFHFLPKATVMCSLIFFCPIYPSFISFLQSFPLCRMAGAVHGTACAPAATGWFSFSLTAYHTDNNRRHHKNQNHADDDCRHILHKPCQHWNPSCFPVINLNAKPAPRIMAGRL